MIATIIFFLYVKEFQSKTYLVKMSHLIFLGIAGEVEYDKKKCFKCKITYNSINPKRKSSNKRKNYLTEYT